MRSSWSASSAGAACHDEAARELQAADSGQCTACSAPLAGLAHDLAGHADLAITAYERGVTDRTFYRMYTDASFLGSSLKRLGELYEAKGDKAKAIGYYQKFVDLWKNADPELQPRVAEVRLRIAKLAPVERPKP